jgi:hypothetical protein
MKGFLQGMNLPQFKDMKLPAKDQAPSQKTVKFDLPEDDDDFDDYDDEFDDEDFEDDDYEDEFDDPHHHLNKMKSMMGNGQKPNMMMMNGMMNGNNPQLMNAQKGGNVAGNAKKGGGGAVPIQVNGMGGGNNEGKNGNGGKKGGGGVVEEEVTIRIKAAVAKMVAKMAVAYPKMLKMVTVVVGQITIKMFPMLMETRVMATWVKRL